MYYLSNLIYFNIKLPLTGLNIAITRAEEQSSETSILFQNNGARVYDMPALIIVPPDDLSLLDNELTNINDFDWIFFSSANGVKSVVNRLRIKHQSIFDVLKSVKIAVVGKKTEQCLRELNVEPDFCPSNYVAESLINEFPYPFEGLKIFLPRVQSGGRAYLFDKLTGEGANVLQVPSYESKCPENIPEETLQALKQKTIHAIVFTSGKTVKNSAFLLCKYLGPNWIELVKGIKTISIGPQTSKVCLDIFKKVDKQAEIYDLDGLLKACEDVFS